MQMMQIAFLVVEPLIMLRCQKSLDMVMAKDYMKDAMMDIQKEVMVDLFHIVP